MRHRLQSPVFCLFVVAETLGGCSLVVDAKLDNKGEIDGGPGEGGGGAVCLDQREGTGCGKDSICLNGACERSVCGDEFVDERRGEVCDDGNTESGDGCSANCRSREVCNNGVVDVGEACDPEEPHALRQCPSDCSLAPVQVAGGWSFTCALLSDGRVSCWGDDSYGQLGDGGNIVRAEGSPQPTDVLGLGDAVHIGAGNDHACAVLSSGQVRCWGRNDRGQLGDGADLSDSGLDDSSRPVSVVGLDDAVELHGGTAHTCARRRNGQVMCWGRNDMGQLGHGGRIPSSDSSTPVTVTGLQRVTGLAVGFQFACGAVAGSQVHCWGYNANGQLGTGESLPGEHSSTPVGPVVGLEGLAPSQIDGFGGHMCLRALTGEVRCWGYNSTGQLGDRTTDSSSTPVSVPSMNARAVTASGHTCAIINSGAVKCWGNNRYGQIGAAPSDHSVAPVSVPLLSNVRQLEAGEFHNCAIVGKEVHCWGRNQAGQLGDGTRKSRHRPAPVVVTWR